MATRIQVFTKPGLPDYLGERVRKRIARDLAIELASVRIGEIYTLDRDFPAEDLEKLRRELFTDPVTQESNLSEPAPVFLKSQKFDWIVEIGFLPGVTDNPGRTAREAIEDLLRVKFQKSESVYTSRQYLLRGRLSRPEVGQVTSALFNPLIERAQIMSRKEFEQAGGLSLPLPRVKLPPEPPVLSVDLNLPDEELSRLGKQGIVETVRNGREIRRGPLALDLDYLHAIRDYFNREGRKPTDLELESIAQTWSEHCKHTIFAACLDGVDGLFKTYIRRSTEEIRKKRGRKDFCVSIFTDNAGVIRFNRDFNLVYKVETHNTPSALDPYGGAITGIVGVNRDPLGTGKGSRLVVNTYGFCFGNPAGKWEPLFRDREKENPVLHPRTVFEGVRRGVEDGGNKSGIPTGFGFVRFDPRYRGKPLVFVGTLGLMPARIRGKPSEKKGARSGDLIVVAGGRVGKDGIHGATFSSEELHAGSPVTAVQIGDPITQKKLGDAQLEARERELYTSVTDNGAGGISCSVGEMARECGGCLVELEKVPLKYPGLAPYEIWISESQERMTYAVPPEKADEFLGLLESRGAEAAVIGKFTDSGRCIVSYRGKKLMDVDLDFLHDGLPRKTLRSKWNPPRQPELKLSEPADYGEVLQAMLSWPNLAGKEFVVRQFDHEVQGGSVIKPLVGVEEDIHSDAVVYRPLLDSREGVAITGSLFPGYGDIDPYWMAADAIDQVIRNLVAAGADPGKIALLDNFCWCSSDEPERLGQLKRACEACYDFATRYQAPFISGKDSMFNDFKGFDAQGGPIKISVPPTLLISGIGIVPDLRRCVTLAAKSAGDLVYVLGLTRKELGGGQYYAARGEKEKGGAYVGASVPQVRPEETLKLYPRVADIIKEGLVASAAPVGEGGLGISLAKKAMAGCLGMEIDLSRVPKGPGTERDDYLLFSESTGRFAVTVDPKKSAKFEKRMKGLPMAKIGVVTNEPVLKARGVKGKEIIRIKIEELKEAYKKTFKDW
ncbi:MAG: AIR synthase-related protein [Proteobacteria bacterium]|nr:AIR synthase-related protein [Pseudomonadota bacterium]